MVTAFPLTCILIKAASLENCEMSGQKRKILSLEECMKVMDRLTKGESARVIPTSLSIGKTQIKTMANDREEIQRRCQDGECSKRK